MKRFYALVALMFFLAAPLVAMDLEAPQGAADLKPAREKIEKKEWAEAISLLEKVVKMDDSAEAYNLLAFSQRNLGQHEQALENYKKALNLDPKFKPAHEYVGELYIKMGQLSKAREHLKILGDLCPSGCEEYDELNEAIQEAK